MGYVEKSKEVYEEAFNTYGDNTKSCLWDKPMIMRYRELVKVATLDGASILEIGCGIGGFYEYLVSDCGIKNITYTGIDLVGGMIELAKEKYPDAHFETRDIFQQPLQKTYDYVFLCGVFFVGADGSKEFMKRMLKEAFALCNKALAFNFISSYVNFKDEGTAYYDPTDVFKYCIENLSWNVNMHHHYEKCDVSAFVYR